MNESEKKHLSAYLPVDPGDENLSLVVVAEQTTNHLATLHKCRQFGN